MVWLKRFLLLLPFFITTLLTELIVRADHLHQSKQHLVGYGFLFGSPWAWLIDSVGLPQPHNYWVQAALGYLFVLWIPAVLYSASIWLLFTLIERLTRRRSE